MRILLVGGAVRNLILGKPVADKDYLVLDADEADLLRAFPQARKAGKDFTAYLVGRDEYALPRPGPGGRAPSATTTIPDPEQAPDQDADQDAVLDADLLGRDLTINAMALDENGALRCHPLALEDLRHRVLRPCSPTALADDPVRAYRAARFAAELPEFAPHPDLLAAMNALARGRVLDALTPERVGKEVLRALAASKPSRFLDLLARTGCLSPWLAELAKGADIPAGPRPWHHESVLGHTGQVLDRLAQARETSGNRSFDPLATTWMALCHDLGKTLTPVEFWPKHHGHDRSGAPLARTLGLRLRLSERLVKAGELAARLHMTAARYQELRPGTRVDLLEGAHRAGLLPELFALVRADHGEDHLGMAQMDLAAILEVRLPENQQDLGPESGRILRSMRAQALSKRKP